MDGIYLLQNSIQEYAWGSHTALAELLGRPSPSNAPQAELWMGAHPKAPSRVELPNGTLSLDRFIDADPTGVLGIETAHRFGNRLPFLFKILAAARPLSIQAHPDLEQARQGFARENARGIDIQAPERNYRDANHKPECICALTDYWALNGFRQPGDIAGRLRDLCPVSLQAVVDQTLKNGDGAGLRRFFEIMMTLDAETCRRVVSEALGNLETLPDNDAAGTWIRNLQADYPYDIGVLSPAILNLVCLKPGEAMYLPAGQLHAYLEGVGVELMANSDNVLRGGLTPKHVDVEELLRVLNFTVSPLDILTPEPVSKTEKVYRTPAAEFTLSVIDTAPGRPHTGREHEGLQILLCTAGQAVMFRQAASEKIAVRKGTCLLVKAAAEPFRIEGAATFYKAAVPKNS